MSVTLVENGSGSRRAEPDDRAIDDPRILLVPVHRSGLPYGTSEMMLLRGGYQDENAQPTDATA
jgi:hypothetical protein